MSTKTIVLIGGPRDGWRLEKDEAEAARLWRRGFIEFPSWPLTQLADGRPEDPFEQVQVAIARYVVTPWEANGQRIWIWRWENMTSDEALERLLAGYFTPAAVEGITAIAEGSDGWRAKYHHAICQPDEPGSRIIRQIGVMKEAYDYARELSRRLAARALNSLNAP